MTARVAADAAARASIRSDLSATLFVEAGAGSGKTTTLVDRVVALVLAPDGAPLHRIAAVTFTEKAAAELRDRVRGRLEEIVRTLGAGPDVARAQEALEDLDSAAIGTLHSFARRTLTEHPIEARLPPLISVADEVGSQVAFESRWRLLLADLLEEESLAETVLLALACGVQTDQLRSIASEFNHEWDRLETAVLAGPEPVPVALDVSVVVTSAQALLGHRGLCVDDTDLFLGHLASLETWLTSLVHATDDAARLRVLAQAQDLKKHNGRRGSWPGCDLEELRTNFVELKERCAALHAATMDTLIRTLARRLAVGTLGWARERQQEGTLEFHDLLVLARELVLDAEHGADVRAALHERYQRLLLDEFRTPTRFRSSSPFASPAAGRPTPQTGATSPYLTVACSWWVTPNKASTAFVARTSPPTSTRNHGSASRSASPQTSGRRRRCSTGSTTRSPNSSRPSPALSRPTSGSTSGGPARSEAVD